MEGLARASLEGVARATWGSLEGVARATSERIAKAWSLAASLEGVARATLEVLAG